MPDEFDPYKPGTGLKDDFDGTIVSASFSPPTGAATNFSLVLDVACDDGDTWQARFGIGSMWDSYDGGETVAFPGKDRQLFDARTAYSDFIVFAMEAGAKDELYSRLKAGLGPTVAANWVGLAFHWNAVDRPSREPLVDELGQPVMDERTGKQAWGNTTRPRTLPTKYLGLENTAAPVPSATTASPAPGGSGVLDGLDSLTAATIRTMAREAPDYDSFIEQMLQLTDANGLGILDHDNIRQALADEQWFESLRG